MKTCCLVVLIFTASVLSNASSAQSVDWVTFPDWSPGDTVGSGLSGDLDVDATFILHSGSFDGRPIYREASAVIEDPDWPYSNDIVPALSALGEDPITHYTLRFDYENEGGLPAGGTIVVIDLEDQQSQVVLTGYAGSVAVPVNWQISFLEVSGADADFPAWEPATSTLTGTTVVAGSARNLVFLVADRSLDAVEFDVTGPADGIDFNTAGQTVDVSAVPSEILPLGSKMLSVKPPVPNPFNPRVQISFTLEVAGSLFAAVYDVGGRRICSLVNSEQYSSGSHRLTWNGRDNQDRRVGSGIYFFRFQSGDAVNTVRAVLVQ